MSPTVLVASFIAVTSFTGCMTVPPPTTPTSTAYALGDRASYGLEEVVVSLPLRGSDTLYQNLHVGLAVIANPVRQTAGSSYEVEGLVRRLETRVRSRLVEVLASAGEQTLDSSGSLRQRVSVEAQDILEQSLSLWTYRSDYRVEIVVVSF